MPSPDDTGKPCKEDQSSKANKVEAKKSNPIEDCKKANPNDNAFCAMPDWKSCAPKDNTKTNCLKLDDCDKKEVNKKKVGSVRIFCMLQI